VGRFIGRLGVVSLPAIEAGLDLDQRVVRRHVARLEAAGWLVRQS
jgi:DNA-binding MarR family transcriptional regulator